MWASDILAAAKSTKKTMAHLVMLGLFGFVEVEIKQLRAMFKITFEVYLTNRDCIGFSFKTKPITNFAVMLAIVSQSQGRADMRRWFAENFVFRLDCIERLS
jgi:hypothetical protein